MKTIRCNVTTTCHIFVIFTDSIEAFNSTSRYLDDLLNIDKPYFEQMVGQMYQKNLPYFN